MRKVFCALAFVLVLVYLVNGNSNVNSADTPNIIGATIIVQTSPFDLVHPAILHYTTTPCGATGIMVPATSVGITTPSLANPQSYDVPTPEIEHNVICPNQWRKGSNHQTLTIYTIRAASLSVARRELTAFTMRL